MMHYLSKLTEEESYQINEGDVITAVYIGEFIAKGLVVNKRAKYGTKNQYQLQLIEDLKIPFKSNGGYKVNEMILVDNTDVIDKSL